MVIVPPEVIVGSDDCNVYAFSAAGELRWAFETGGRVRSSPAVADLDGDGILEVIVGSDDGKIYALSAQGERRWAFEAGDWIRSSPAVADLDGDGALEVIFGSGDGKLYVWAPREVRTLWSFSTRNQRRQ